jgi:hypothetical protein
MITARCEIKYKSNALVVITTWRFLGIPFLVIERTKDRL